LPSSVLSDTTDAFHIYRITSQGGNYNLYIDGVSVSTGTAQSISGGPAQLFGDFGIYGGVSKWDYLTYADTGAYSPAQLASIAVSDTTPPTVTLSSTESSTTNASPIPVTATFDEDVTGFELGDISVGGGFANNFDDSGAPVYTFDVIPTSAGAVTVDVAASAATDAGGNGNTAATQFSITSNRIFVNIDFDALVSGSTTYTEDGFTFTSSSSSLVRNDAFGLPPPPMIHNADGPITITNEFGASFDFFSVEPETKTSKSMLTNILLDVILN